MKHNIIKIENGAIIIQSCDDELAHIGICYNDYTTYYHISVPELAREWKLIKYTEMRPDIFDRILEENKAKVLETIQVLNGTP